MTICAKFQENSFIKDGDDASLKIDVNGHQKPYGQPDGQPAYMMLSADV